MTTPPIAEPRVLTDAVQVLAHPDSYHDRPSLLHLARIVAMSAAGLTPAQRHPAGPPVLRAIIGGAA